MSRRINVLLGAGAVMDYTKVTTQSITESLYVDNKGDCKGEPFLTLKSMGNALTLYYRRNATFEDIHHLLMVMLSYTQKDAEPKSIEQHIFLIK